MDKLQGNLSAPCTGIWMFFSSLPATEAIAKHQTSSSAVDLMTRVRGFMGILFPTPSVPVRSEEYDKVTKYAPRHMEEQIIEQCTSTKEERVTWRSCGRGTFGENAVQVHSTGESAAAPL